jgi:spectinomycin phosphotransferase
VDTPPPPDLDEADLSAALNAEWDLQADNLCYLPKGAGSYHWIVKSAGQSRAFVTVDDLGTKPWIAEGGDATFEGLRSAYEAAWDLEHGAGLAVIVGPTRSRDGSVILRLSDNYSIATFPFVDGVSGTWGEPVPPEVRTRLLRDLAGLHQATGTLETRLAVRQLDVPERPLLMAALDALGTPWDAGPLSERARLVLGEHEEEVRGWLTELDRLALDVRGAESQLVVTHGEPHPANLIHTNAGLRLIDWDTVALAVPERDLWMLDDGSPDAFATYEEKTGRTVSDTAVRFYRLAWTLSDIASFAHMLRTQREPTRWVEAKRDGFEGLLEGATSAPYG